DAFCQSRSRARTARPRQASCRERTLPGGGDRWRSWRRQISLRRPIPASAAWNRLAGARVQPRLLWADDSLPARDRAAAAVFHYHFPRRHGIDPPEGDGKGLRARPVIAAGGTAIARSSRLAG